MQLPDTETIRQWFSQQLVHYSFKVVNTNISPGGGVRISQDQKLHFPHICAHTALCERDDFANEVLSGLDCTANLAVSGPDRHDASKNARVGPSKLLTAVRFLRGESVKMDAPPALDLLAQTELLEAYAEVASRQPAVLNGDRLSPRLRQILLPRNDDYLAVTPLTSTGVGLSVSRAVRARDDDFFARLKAGEGAVTRRIPRVSQFSVGGSKPQNAGVRVGEWTRRPLVFDSVPRMGAGLKRAFHLAYSGFHYRLPVQLVSEHQSLLAEMDDGTASKASEISWTMRNREREQVCLSALWRAIERQAADVRECLSEHAQDLPNPLPALEKDAFLEGWLDPDKRSREWREGVSRIIADDIVSMVRGRSFEPHRIFELDDSDARRMADALAQGGAE
ncbi:MULTISPECIES: hypothetical protein [unclassified Thioalkalivibrio]|uniref:hypothetical protein n=1 Tax=unclassified Thioalkalivibrio TaxID=2621013 RepID=UPI0003A95DBF|nr:MULTISPECIES: hypothetical protein [unclassified Thioalkalivibrio]